MFTAPHPEDIPMLTTDPGKVRGLQHDMVLNGFEVGGGSVRIHDSKVQQQVFDLIGFSEEQKAEFDHMLTAFTYGVPPHGGIAPGLDRLLMVLLGEPSVREVMAFPTSASGGISVMDAPSVATQEQLEELKLFSDQKIFDEKISVYQKIIDKLDKSQIKYQHYEHKPVFTSEDSARIRGTTMHQGAKALVMQADNKVILFVLPADLKADVSKLGELIGVKKLILASKDLVETKTGLEIGSIPPVGSVMGLKTYTDSRLSENEEIAFNAGRHDRSIKMRYEDFLRIENPEVVKM